MMPVGLGGVNRPPPPPPRFFAPHPIRAVAWATTVNLRRLVIAIFASLALAAVIVRISGCFAPLWFDEVNTLRFAKAVRWVPDIFRVWHYDAKHHLILLWDWLVGPRAPYFAYRIPSLLAGLALPLLIYGATWRRHGKRTAALAAFFVLVSYHLIDLSCEARGYPLAMAFSAAAYWVCDRFLQTGRPALARWFALCCILGFLSHLTFFYIYSGLALWSVWELRRRQWSELFDKLFMLHGPVGLALLLLYWYDLQYMFFLGGPHLSLGELLGKFMGLTFNLPGPGTTFLGWVIAVLIVWGFVLICRRGAGDGPFYVGMILSAAGALCYRLSLNVAPRYLAIAAPFLMVLLAVAADQFLAIRYLRPALLTVIAALAGWGIYLRAAQWLDRTPRYPDAVGRMAADPADAPFIACGTDNWMDHILLSFYCPRLNRPFWLDSDSMRIPVARWWIVSWPALHAPTVTRDGRRYALVSVCPEHGSAWAWDLYRIAPPP
jgi:hypothetical protein